LRQNNISNKKTEFDYFSGFFPSKAIRGSTKNSYFLLRVTNLCKAIKNGGEKKLFQKMYFLSLS